MFIKLMVITIN